MKAHEPVDRMSAVVLGIVLAWMAFLLFFGPWFGLFVRGLR